MAEEPEGHAEPIVGYPTELHELLGDLREGLQWVDDEPVPFDDQFETPAAHDPDWDCGNPAEVPEWEDGEGQEGPISTDGLL